jgi:hypothetical protein
MSTHTALLRCEGPACNSGRSAEQREADLMPRGIAENVRHEHMRAARSAVTQDLAYTRHSRSGVGRYGVTLYACDTCGHERIYG